MPTNQWDSNVAESLSGLELLAYRSRLLASDRTVVNIFGGNTSSKVLETDHTGKRVSVLWVKGSGSDMADCSERSFAGLKLEEVLPLMNRDDMNDEEMVAYLSACAFQPNRPRQSIETLLHAFLNFEEIDHSHPDSVISLACTKKGEAAAREVFGNRMVWVDYMRPGFLLSKRIAEAVSKNSNCECVVMGKHGLVTWGGNAQECYENTIRIINEAEQAINAVSAVVWTGGLEKTDPFEFLPELRGAVSKFKKQIVLTDSSDRVLQMVNSLNLEELSQKGAACPDHLVHVKRKPMIGLSAADVDKYRKEYEDYFANHASKEDLMHDSAPRVILSPKIGMFTCGKTIKEARTSQELYHRAIEVIEGAEKLGGFECLTEKEAFEIEYWPLELFKLKQKPNDLTFTGHIVMVTGAASGIGRATAIEFAKQGACVALLDINAAGINELQIEIGENSIAIPCDLTKESDVMEAMRRCVNAFGGLDILVCSAGIAGGAPVEEVTVTEWERNFSVLAKGYFLPSREAFKIWKKQKIGGSLIFVTSKNAIAAGKNASAYSAAKASEQHLARCLAEEGGEFGIRVNTVLPDAVIRGSSIWDSDWKKQRAESYKISETELEEFYRNRTTLKKSVYPQDVANAILFLAGPLSEKTTGAALTVDGGIPGVYVR